MATMEMKLKQASAVLGISPKTLQNFVQARVLKPRRQGSVYYFDRNTLLQARVVLYLKVSLGASTRYLTKFTEAISELPGFGSGTLDVVCLKSGAWKNEQPVRILIPLGDLANEVEQRLPFAAAAKDLPRGRKRTGWKREFRAALVEAARDLDGISKRQILETVKAYRKERSKPGLTVVAEAVEATA
jgi:DNA-binding transcriptional MerR regulator